LTDFGFATTWKKGEKQDLSLGSPLYMAPELVREEEYDNRVDVWSIGVIAYILLSGTPPFAGRTREGIDNAIMYQNLKFGAGFPRVSEAAKNFIEQCLVKDYTKRPQVSELLKHPWLNLVSKPTPDAEVELKIGGNLFEFQKTNSFQSGIISFIANVQSNVSDLDELAAMFKRLDVSKDGRLQKEELRAGLNELAAYFDYDEKFDFDDLFKTMDSDGSGEVDFTEFITAAIDKRALLTKENIDAAFRTFDADGNGRITKDELMAVFAAGKAGSATTEVWEKIMADVDKNGDGEIDYEEFQTAMTTVLKKGVGVKL
jgi:calcium-dependent protein kinase